MIWGAADSMESCTKRAIAHRVWRGSRVFIVTVPAAARIDPPRACLAIRDTILARAAVEREKYFGSNGTDTAALKRSTREDDASDVAYRRCYGERAPRDPAFKKIVAQVRGVATMLPPR